MENEIWKGIPGYEGKYQVSNMGRVKSLRRIVQSSNQNGAFQFILRERILRPGSHDKANHMCVVLNDPRKTYTVHQLVMLAFEGPPPPGKVVCHNNGDATDNRLSNLRYDTQRENVIDVFRLGRAWKKLTTEDVEAIRFGRSTGITCKELGLMYGVAHQTISKVTKGVTFTWVR